jgi:hypothetical protein
MIKIASKTHIEKWIKTAIIVTVNFLLWVIPSNVAYLIAQNKDVLLGRYGLTRFIWIILVTPISIMALYLIWSNEKNKKERQFQVTALVLSIIVPILLIDLFVRLAKPQRNVAHKSYYYREPNTTVKGTFHDVPENAFSYPVMRPGYPDVEYTLTTDKRGFRNKTDHEKYDIVALGDSFTDGSNISDDEAWAVLLAQQSDQTVYNLGMGGANPKTYLEIFKKFGLALSPKILICMLYEGNDFRDSNYRQEDSIGRRLSRYFKNSPVRRAFIDSLIRRLGPKGNGASKGSIISADNAADNNATVVKALSWMPVGVPEGPDEKYYTFTVKNLLVHLGNRDTFLRSKGCQETFAYIRQIKELCDTKNFRLIIVYAPDKSHVLLPLIRHKVSPEDLRAFLALKANNLPSVRNLMDTVLAHLEIEESAVKEFCLQESIEFVSLVESLRKGMNLRQQLYFTYDDHWTPMGHEVTANTISHYLDEHPVRTIQSEK